jgi:hypothetical protein
VTRDGAPVESLLFVGTRTQESVGRHSHRPGPVYAKLDAGLPELAEDEDNACWAVLGTKRRARAAEMRTTTAGRERCWRASHVAAVILGKYGGDHGAGARRALVLTDGRKRGNSRQKARPERVRVGYLLGGKGVPGS